MTIETLAADLAARVPELARDGIQNRQTIIANLIREWQMNSIFSVGSWKETTEPIKPAPYLSVCCQECGVPVDGGDSLCPECAYKQEANTL